MVVMSQGVKLKLQKMKHFSPRNGDHECRRGQRRATSFSCSWYARGLLA
jgi:hypothetical protein